jgi:hypothetical protein
MIEMSQVFTVHEPKICEICKETMQELQVSRYTCVCCGLTED